MVLAACDAGEERAGSGSAALGSSRFGPAPGWAASAEVVARRGAWALLRGEAEPVPVATDVRAVVPFAVVRDDGAALLPPEPAIDAALLDGAVAWLGVERTLWIDDGAQLRAIDDDVHGELSTDASGTWLAWAVVPGERAGVWVASLAEGTPRRVTEGLGVADRPVFLDDERLVVVGAVPGGIAGVWVARYREVGAQPVPITNASLRAGQPLGAGFVPPPAYHASMRVDGDVLVYDDGERERRVELAGAQR
jgi:hypothetical protein